MPQPWRITALCLTIVLGCGEEAPPSDAPTSSSTGDASTGQAGSSSGAVDGSTGDASSSGVGEDSSGVGESSSSGVGESSSGSTDAPDTSGCGHVLFINFDGATLAAGPEDATINSNALGFEGELAPYRGGQREDLLQRFTDLFAAYDVCVFDQRPEAGPYTMAVLTDTTPPEVGPTTVAIGPGLDCANTFESNVVIGFAANADTATLLNGVGRVLGNSYGLETVTTAQCPTPMPCGEPEIMVEIPDSNPGRGFFDQCWSTDGPACSTNDAFCDGGGQNSHQYLLDVLGPAPR